MLFKDILNMTQYAGTSQQVRDGLMLKKLWVREHLNGMKKKDGIKAAIDNLNMHGNDPNPIVMWIVLEFEAYLERNGHSQTVRTLRSRKAA